MRGVHDATSALQQHDRQCADARFSPPAPPSCAASLMATQFALRPAAVFVECAELIRIVPDGAAVV